MVTFVPAFVNQACADHRAATTAEQERLGLRGAPYDPMGDAEALQPYRAWLGANPRPVATVDDVVAHLEHAREVVGVEHLGLGGDFDGVDELPAGLGDVSCYPVLLQALADQGWSGADLRGLTSGNVLRVLEAAQDGTSVD